jgi:endonuclease/exonuclease/phosphatase family metal-dependent hydrolase
LNAAPRSNSSRATAITWNVSYSLSETVSPTVGVKAWEDRRDAVAAYVQPHDIVALQELSGRQFDDLAMLLPLHRPVAVKTPLPQVLVDAIRERFGSFEPHLIEIGMFLSEAFSVLEQGHCWLSPTPGMPLSIGYENVTPRQLLWVVACHRASNRRVLIATTHIDWRSVRPMLRLVRERLKHAVADVGAGLLLGDLNTHTAPREIAGMLRDGWRDTHPTGRLDEDETYFGDLQGGPGRIDHVLVKGALRAEQWWRGTDVTALGLSDHLAVGASLLFD